MKLLSSIVLAIATVASGAAAAATYNSDADRREQNREEALSRWRADHGTNTSASVTDRDAAGRPTLRERSRTTAAVVRNKTHRGADSVRHFTHRQAEKARNFSERQDRRYGKKGTPNSAKGEGGN